MDSKAELRQKVAILRKQLPDREALSRRISAHITSLPQWQLAKTKLFYVNVRSEVETTPLLRAELALGRLCIVPYCEGEALRLISILQPDELTAGAFGIPEPSVSLRDRSDRQIPPSEIDIVLVPGLAFDLTGARLGHGKGYYDRLLAQVRSDCLRIGLAFDCQLVPKIPVEPHDERVHMIITPEQILHTSPPPGLNGSVR